MLSDLGGGELVSVLDVQSEFFLLKKSGFGPWPDFMVIIYYWLEFWRQTVKPSFNDSIALFVG